MTMSLTIGARLGPRWTRVVALFVSGLCALASSSAGQPAEDAPWFGVAMPPAFEPHVPPVIVGERGVAPAVVPPGEDAFTALTGGALQVHLASIVQFSRTSREKREIGSGQLWGRITGFPSGHDTVSWAAGRFEEAGIDDVRRQPFDQEPGAEFWLPLSWEMRLLGDPAFGAGTEDLVLTTAMPLAPSAVPPEGLEAPLVHAGFGTVAELTQIDVRGKVAVLHVTPQGHLVFERGAAVPRARALFERGALGVINVIDLPGNERARDFSNCGGPCFNLGGRAGRFLETVMDRAADAGVLDRLRVRFALETTRRSGLSAHNAIAVIPGSERPDETIIINAHADAWFDGADDNGDGLAVLVGLARHFATEADPPRRTLVFVASAGHHSPGMNGPRNFVAMNPAFADSSVIALNIEHVAQRNLSPARSVAADGYREFVADAGEAPIVAGVSNAAPFLEDLFRRGVERYGTNFVFRSVDDGQRRRRRLSRPRCGDRHHHAGAAALPHQWRGGRGDLGARAGTDGAVPRLLPQAGGCGAAGTAQSAGVGRAVTIARARLSASCFPFDGVNR